MRFSPNPKEEETAVLGDVAEDEVDPSSALGPKDTEQVQVRELEEQRENLSPMERWICCGN